MIKFGYVAPKSGHSRGSAVDLTLYDLESGVLLPMGGDFDFMDTASHFAAAGLTKYEIKNRRLLRSIMESCGFIPLDCEWWHYLLRNEPYPDTYFDFPIAY